MWGEWKLIKEREISDISFYFVCSVIETFDIAKEYNIQIDLKEAVESEYLFAKYIEINDITIIYISFSHNLLIVQSKMIYESS